MNIMLNPTLLEFAQMCFRCIAFNLFSINIKIHKKIRINIHYYIIFIVVSTIYYKLKILHDHKYQ